MIFYSKTPVETIPPYYMDKDNYLIECTLCVDLPIIYSDEFGTTTIPPIEDIVEKTNQVLADLHKLEIPYPLFEREGKDFPFMKELGIRGFSFYCKERADAEDCVDIFEVIIPENIMRNPNLFTQISYSPPDYTCQVL